MANVDDNNKVELSDVLDELEETANEGWTNKRRSLLGSLLETLGSSLISYNQQQQKIQDLKHLGDNPRE